MEEKKIQKPEKKYLKRYTNKKFRRELGKHLRMIRKERNLGIEEVNKHAYLSKNHLIRIERADSNVTIGTLYSLSLVYNISLSDIFNFEFTTNEIHY